MRSAIVQGRGRAAIAQLCSACGRDAAGPAMATTLSSPITRNPAVRIHARRPVLGRLEHGSGGSMIPRRWFSQGGRNGAPTSTSPQNKEEEASSSSGDSGRGSGSDTANRQSTSSSSSSPAVGGESETRSHRAPPPFYSIFPETLPDGPPPSGPFHIDVRALRREFLRLQAGTHPDLHGGGSGAEAASALLNEAYRTLASPLGRAQYLLRERFGLDMAGDEAGQLAEPEPEVLGAVLEARELIEEAAAEEELEGLKEENEERIARAEEVLGRAFAEGDVELAKAEVVRLRYWMNVRESINNWESGKPIVLQH